MEGFFEWNHDVRLHVVAALCAHLPASKSAAAKCRPPAAAAKKLLEEIAEAGAVEFELDATVAAAIAIESAAWLALLRSPVRWRLKSSRLVPIGAELIVLLALLRIAQHLVSFINLLEFFFSGLFILRDIGMIFARQLAERALDFIVARRLGDAERFVIIPELHRHRAPTLCRPRFGATLSDGRRGKISRHHWYSYRVARSNFVERLCPEVAGIFARRHSHRARQLGLLFPDRYLRRHQHLA